jgi:hypothetical protein
MQFPVASENLLGPSPSRSGDAAAYPALPCQAINIPPLRAGASATSKTCVLAKECAVR